jgi:hypothetical protein
MSILNLKIGYTLIALVGLLVAINLLAAVIDMIKGIIF